MLDFPEPFASIFERVFPFDTFNRVQTAVADKALTDETLLVLAPTGAGKTVFFELAIVRLFADNFVPGKPKVDKKAVFLAPAKFLVRF